MQEDALTLLERTKDVPDVGAAVTDNPITQDDVREELTSDDVPLDDFETPFDLEQYPEGYGLEEDVEQQAEPVVEERTAADEQAQEDAQEDAQVSNASAFS
jgi:hypothetical protein